MQTPGSFRLAYQAKQGRSLSVTGLHEGSVGRTPTEAAGIKIKGGKQVDNDNTEREPPQGQRGVKLGILLV